MVLSPKQPKKVSGGLLLIIFIVLSVALMTIWLREGTGGPIHTVRSGVAVVTAPLQYVGATIARPFQAIGNAFTNLTADQDDIGTLTRENEELRAKIIQLEEYRLENGRLSALLELSDPYNLQTVGARIINRSSDSWNRTITINKGSSAGLEVGMPVMSANGLLGQIESVSSYTSVVRLVTDEQSGVAVMVQESRVEGILTGSVDGLLYLRYIPVSTSVSVGDSIITSGLGGIYPKGIAVGTVASVDSAGSDVYLTILIEPIAHVSTYEEVLVLIGNESEVASSATTDAADTDSDSDTTDSDTADSDTAESEATTDE